MFLGAIATEGSPDDPLSAGGKGSRMSIFLPLPVALHALSQGLELATTVLGEQKPQQDQDDEIVDEYPLNSLGKGFARRARG